MLRLGSALPSLLLPGLAAAEVCDKVAGDSWRREDGPIDAFGWSSAWRLAAFILVSFFLIWLFRSTKLAWIVAGLWAIGAIFSFVSVFSESGDITRAAIREGCISPDPARAALLSTLVFSLLASLYVAVASTRVLVRR